MHHPRFHTVLKFYPSGVEECKLCICSYFPFLNKLALIIQVDCYKLSYFLAEAFFAARETLHYETLCRFLSLFVKGQHYLTKFETVAILQRLNVAHPQYMTPLKIA